MTIEKAIKNIKDDALYNPETAEICIKALEKQIAKKVKHITKKRRPIMLFLETYDVLVCEACGEEVLCEENYCHHCGQALDWSEE